MNDLNDFSKKTDAEKVENLLNLYLWSSTELVLVSLENRKLKEELLSSQGAVYGLQLEIGELTEALRKLWIASDLDAYLHPIMGAYVVEDTQAYLKLMDAKKEAEEYLRDV